MPTQEAYRRIAENIRQAEAIVLSGLQYPYGRTVQYEKDIAELAEVSIAIAKAYAILKRQGIDDPNDWKRVRFLARAVTTGNPDYRDYDFRAGGTPHYVQVVVERVAAEARTISLTNGLTEEAKISSGRLFRLLDEVYAANIPHKERGCSSSICTNCDEPTAFADQECPNCKVVFIGPFGFPNIDQWQRLSLADQQANAIKVYKSCNHGKLEIL